jgi:hypothetical protein
MKKLGLLVITVFVAACAIIISCNKAVKIPLSYTVVSNHQNVVSDIFIPDSGTYDMQIMAKYWTGATEDAVTLVITGLPADISVTPDTFSAIPSFVEDFVFSTKHAAHKTYKITIVASAPDEISQTYTFNLTVVSADCAAAFLGSLTGHNACSITGSTNHTATATSPAQYELSINNFGGYGTNTNTTVYFNCDNDSLSIPNQNIGNGVVLQGSGIFTATTLSIAYSTTGTSTDNCTVTYTK